MKAAARPGWSRHRWLAAGVGLAGAIALVVGLVWGGPEDAPASDGARRGRAPSATNQSGNAGHVGKSPSRGPGGVGVDPEKTGLPAAPAAGGKVRTGTKEQGCFATMREYLDQWDRTGREPDPCFLTQPASEQPQPDGVKRTYNGERF